jgi:hypothetical protein
MTRIATCPTAIAMRGTAIAIRPTPIVKRLTAIATRPSIALAGNLLWLTVEDRR